MLPLVSSQSATVDESTAPSQRLTTRATGGPGPFGYTWEDTTGFTSFVDISGTGTLAMGPTDDSVVAGLPLPFTFNFYGTDYNQFGVGSNGHIYFGSTDYLGLANTCPLPATQGYTPQTFIAIYHDDLVIDSGIYYSRDAGTAKGGRNTCGASVQVLVCC